MLKNLRTLLIALFLCAPAQANEQKTAVFHLITEDTPSLGLVSVYCYGSTRYWRKIAAWNHLPPPFRLKPGQKLWLKKAPTLTPEQGEKKLLAMWRKRLGLPSLDEIAAKEMAVKKKAAQAEYTHALKEAQNEEQEDEPDSPEACVARGQKEFDAKQYDAAIADFEKARDADPDTLAAWFYEIRTLRILKKDQEAKAISIQLLKNHPELQNLPMFKDVKE